MFSSSRSKAAWIFVILTLSLFLSILYPEEGMAMKASEEMSKKQPLIDQEAPDNFETATFALG